MQAFDGVLPDAGVKAGSTKVVGDVRVCPVFEEERDTVDGVS